VTKTSLKWGLMLRQFNRFILLALIVAAALYVTLTNSDTATLKLGPRLTVTTYAGVIYIGTFVAGCIAASLVALFFGLKGYFRERKLLAQERARQNFYKTQETARCQMAAGDWAAARALWEDVLHSDPDNVVARVELSRCIEQLGDLNESLRVLDATRASNRSNVEVLFRAAQLNQRLGNNTAALDNAKLILASGPSHRALELARDASEALDNYDQALNYQDELEGIGYQSEQNNLLRAKLTYGRITRGDPAVAAKKEALLTLLKRHPEYAPALESLANMEREAGNLELCVEYMMRAARASGSDVSKWQGIVDLWLSSDDTDSRRRTERAIAVARSATKDTHGAARLDAELLLIRTLLAVNHFQEAEKAIDAFPTLANKEAGGLTSDLSRLLTIQRGYCL